MVFFKFLMPSPCAVARLSARSASNPKSLNPIGLGLEAGRSSSVLNHQFRSKRTFFLSSINHDRTDTMNPIKKRCIAFNVIDLGEASVLPSAIIIAALCAYPKNVLALACQFCTGLNRPKLSY
ncbi:hypothetical protein PGTUg99_024179 [Puccinia graminis f. sp. tritici]|uniref:Uncharacterized protein n=1 Tax=Puccinia graminis f. sp. tritici TaxID=56615 RepID=A0A5B0SKY4_PUCGR|nr:hypothetical protein PGTUg99_024179 [Puccinia graminis f. sp. tritici]